MLKISSVLTLVAATALVAGCAGPESKLGRGITNVTEFTRGGEISRSMEQTAIFGSPDEMLTTGFLHGVGLSMQRTAVGAYEIATFPIPNHANCDYGPVLHPADPVYPESYKPNWISTSFTQPDANLGFSGGDLAPFLPGSRFRIFDN